MRYGFKPQATHAAARRIAERFPLDRAGAPLGIAMLFKLLEQIALDQVGPWGKSLRDEDLDTLCQYYHRAPSAKVVAAILVLLAFRDDVRAGTVCHYFFHLLPSSKLLRELATPWHALDMRERVAGHFGWLGRYSDHGFESPVIEFVCGDITAGKLTVTDLEDGIEHETPLLESLMELFFERGGALLAGLKPDRASAMAALYLESGKDRRVINYLNDYPDTNWRADFLEKLYQIKGPPDPRNGVFYRSVEKGRIWSVRRRLFDQRAGHDQFSAVRQEFWQRWCERIQDWQWRGRNAWIVIHPLIVVDEPERSFVYFADQPDVVHEDIRFDSMWEENMEVVLSEHVQWGYHV